MKIRALVTFSAGGLVLLLAIGALAASSSINMIRMGGPLQRETQEISDLVADILPPPEYIIEPYLETTLLRERPDELQERAARLEQLRGQYDDRHGYWLKSDLDEALVGQLTEGAHRDAMQFWNEIDQHFLPAVRARDTAAIDSSYARLAASYAAHRRKIDETVTAATEFQASVAVDAKTRTRQAMMMLAGAALLALAGVGTFCWLMMRRVVKPLSSTAEAMHRMSEGDLAVSVAGASRKDEIGELARAVTAFKRAEEVKRALEAASQEKQSQQNVAVERLSEALQRLAHGDLTRAIEQPMAADYESLRTNYNDALSELRSLIGILTGSADAIRTGSSEVAQASEDLARRTEASAASLEETSAALVQIDQRLQATAEAAEATVSRADQAIATVGEGRSVAEQAVAAMNRVSESAKSIDTVIGGLDKIAFQTRVLAMNAAVEAGRAGHAGRGFAVVADLVSALAMRSEEEAKRARDLLTATHDDVVAAVDAVQCVDGAFANIFEDVANVHALLGAMAADNQAQSIAVTQISSAIGSIDHMAQQNAAMVEETSAAARNLTAEMNIMVKHVSTFRIDTAPLPASGAPFQVMRSRQVANPALLAAAK